MSSQMKEAQEEENRDFYSAGNQNSLERSSKVNLNDLVNRLNVEKKKERKNNIIISVAAVSAVAAFGVILTL